MNIGILYIATGRYITLWDDFYKSCERFLTPTATRHYFVFTDCLEPIAGEETGRVHRYHQDKLGWPYDTLMRFEIFLKAEEEIKQMDYLFFFNGTAEIIKEIKVEDIIDVDKPLVGAIHPFFATWSKEQFTYDRNPQSLAYMAPEEGEYYYMGGLNGGAVSDAHGRGYLSLIRDLAERTQRDLANGVIALWHDESHLNRYLWENRDRLKTLPISYGVPEVWIRHNPYRFSCKIYDPKKMELYDTYIVMRDKHHPRFGGVNYMRGLTDKRVGYLRFLLAPVYHFLRRACINLFRSTPKE